MAGNIEGASSQIPNYNVDTLTWFAFIMFTWYGNLFVGLPKLIVFGFLTIMGVVVY